MSPPSRAMIALRGLSVPSMPARELMPVTHSRPCSNSFHRVRPCGQLAVSSPKLLDHQLSKFMPSSSSLQGLPTPSITNTAWPLPPHPAEEEAAIRGWKGS